MNTNNPISLYACGGTATNIAKKLHRDNTNSQNGAGFGVISTFYIDTSSSNVTEEVANSGSFFRISGTEAEPINGSGMVRKANHKAISRAIPEILHSFKPGVLNIVLHSASGGSGSVIGPELVSELLNNNEAVIVITVGSTTCVKEITNTQDTIASYQSISSKRGKPVMVSYLENGIKPMRVNDDMARLQILLLAAIWSGENFGLDDSDLYNFINYNHPAPQYPAMLTSLSFLFAEERDVQPAKGEAVAAILTMVKDGEDADPGMTVGYHTFGQFSEAASDVITCATPITLRATQGTFTNTLSWLKSKLTSVQENIRANQAVGFNVDTGSAEDSGIVL